ncbi:FAD binding domain-containing protein [Streptomyces sp. 840.1]|uniref:FAD-binding protein n=1 Tax=Streptomyces sp. 840.1 TaxID=2485152 RepID=UPI000FBABA14|nr:FAD-binding protein [Streptomyces sp. 840.1]ROQ70054.1 FAD binding domain-containing protein [Streptomyces sp. 840.1]
MSARTSHYESDALPTETVDAVVIGGGAAGLNGALMPARSRRSVVVIDSGTPRNAPVAAMHGYIVLEGTVPSDILECGRRQVREHGGRVVLGTWPRPEPAPSQRTVICGSPSPWPTAVRRRLAASG